MKKYLLLLTLGFFCCVNQETNNKDHKDQTKTSLENYITGVMEVHNIPGLALAVIQNDSLVFEGYFGKSSFEQNKEVNENTLFRIFSATKLITSTAVFQLVQNQQLNLEDKISDHLDDLPDEWSDVELRNLLSHSSGLPDIIRYKSTLSDEELMSKLTEAGMEFTIGNQFRYNQTNYWLLARIIEKITEMPFDEYVLKHQFSESKNGVTFSSNAQDSIPNRATRYVFNGETKEFEKDTNNNGKRAHSGNGLNITLKEFMKWNKRLDDGHLLNEETKNRMWKPFKFGNNKDIFLHGWGTYTVGNLDSYGFTGGNLAAFRKFNSKDVTIILLSNGYEIPAYDMIVNDVARMVIPELKTKVPELEENLMKLVVNGQYTEASTSYEKLRLENPNSDFDNLRWNINGLGNSYLYGEKDSSKALQVFKFNAEANPDWWVSLASLAELYDAQKDSLKAIETYKKAIEVNKDNAWNYNEQMKNRISALGEDQP